MDKALVGILVVFGFLHLLLLVIPVITTARATISTRSKMLWILFLLFLPLIGVAFFHFRFRISLFHGSKWEPTAHDLGARNPHDTTKPRD